MIKKIREIEMSISFGNNWSISTCIEQMRVDFAKGVFLEERFTSSLQKQQIATALMIRVVDSLVRGIAGNNSILRKTPDEYFYQMRIAAEAVSLSDQALDQRKRKKMLIQTFELEQDFLFILSGLNDIHLLKQSMYNVCYTFEKEVINRIQSGEIERPFNLEVQ